MAVAVPEIDFYEFSHCYLKEPRSIEQGTLELTYRCNLNCVHCYCNHPALRQQTDELTIDQICAIIDAAVKRGCLWIAFTGGEPLLREDFFELYLYAKRKGLFITLLTNGTLIDERTADFFSRWPPRRIEISLYGATRQTYERVTGVPGSFDQCMAGIDRLCRRNLTVEIKTMALTLNRHEIAAIKQLAESRGLFFRYDPLVHRKLNGDDSPAQYRLSAEETVDLDRELGILEPELEKQCRLYAGTEQDPEKLFNCGAGLVSFHVTPCGDLQACGFPLPERYNLKIGSFEEGWDQFIPRMTTGRRQVIDNACSHCRVWALCKQCALWAFHETGDQEEMVDYICALYKERAARLISKELIRH